MGVCEITGRHAIVTGIVIPCGGMGDEQTSRRPMGGCEMSRRHAVPWEDVR